MSHSIVIERGAERDCSFLLQGRPIPAAECVVRPLGLSDLGPSILPFGVPPGKWKGYIRSDSTAGELAALPFMEILPHFGLLSFPIALDWTKFIKRVYVFGGTKDGESRGVLTFPMEIWADEWANPFTVDEFEDALESVLGRTEEILCNEPNHLIDWYGFDPFEFPDHNDAKEKGGTCFRFDFTVLARSADLTVADEITFWSGRLKDVVNAASRMILRNRKDALVTFFEFPVPIRTACEQYLIYFTQFLEDLGIAAVSEVRHAAGSVMFSVFPKDGYAALEQIRAALEIYLQIPREPDFPVIAAPFQDAAVLQLRANVLHLQSQLALAKAIVQAKDATIQSLDLTIHQQKQLLTTIAATSSVAPPQAKYSEPLIADLVSVTEYEGKGIKVNLPLILRRLKRRLGLGGSEHP